MSMEEPGAEAPYPEPRASAAFFGHEDAERRLLDAYRTGRIPHAWLLGGPAGIGKATLAFRLARFVLAHGDASAPAVQAAQSLAVDPAHPVARQVAGQAHPDLLVLERTENDSGNLRTVITVDQVRRTISFFGFGPNRRSRWHSAPCAKGCDMNQTHRGAILEGAVA